uniref:Uncharacterized protein n=1 Tax=Salix viminalis TaxID=40686 RepID=A0A6N2MXT8_SALVM
MARTSFERCRKAHEPLHANCPKHH